MTTQRTRIRFSKQGDLRMISHRDLLRTLERLFRRADLRLAMTAGFHPRPRLSFSSPLSLGVAALDEVMELHLAQTYDADELLDRLRQHAVPGLEFHGVEVLTRDEPKGQVENLTYEFSVPAERRSQAADSIETFLAQEQHLVSRTKRPAPVDVRAGVRQLELDGELLRMTLSVHRQATARPREVLAAIGLADLEQQGCYLTRTTVQLASQR